MNTKNCATLITFTGSYLAFEPGDMRYHVIDAEYTLTQKLAQSILKLPDGTSRFAIHPSLAQEIAGYDGALYGAIDDATGAAVMGPGQSVPPAELPKEPNDSEGWFRYVGTDNAARSGVFTRAITRYGAYRVYFAYIESPFGFTLDAEAAAISMDRPESQCGFWSEVQRFYEKRICTSLPSSLSIA
jgi:hypothetical protein